MVKFEIKLILFFSRIFNSESENNKSENNKSDPLFRQT